MLLQGKQVFVVEDDATNLAIISAILRRHGATVHHDRWGVDTVQRITGMNKVDIILLDLMFPQGVSGYDVFDHIRAEEELADVPVVAVSASDPNVEMNKARSKGFMGFISKPISHKDFPQQIATILRGQPVWDGDVMVY